ncbi:MAG: pilus assembly protein [Moraxellaceae bacterium]
MLASSFETIFARIADTNGTMASPGVAVNQLNRSQHLDQLYYGVFKPAQTKRWAGNLKRYRLGMAGSSDAILDVTGANAVDSATTFFSTNARSWWSDAVDGNNADKGGAASKQTAARKVYIDSGSDGPMTLLDPANPPTGMSDVLVKWVQGIDVDDENGDGDSTDARRTMGAPVHAQPTLVSYGSSNEDFVVFVGTNDGLLHSINVNDGSENWSWLPSDLIGIQSILRSNPGVGASAKPQYGLDGNWTVVRTATKTLLVGGMRQGGSNIYAVRLPTTKTGAPYLEWVIKPTTSANFADIGYTWSQPVQTRVRIGGVVRDVLVFGGGLDYDVYEVGGAAATSGGSDKGRQVYMVEAATGNLLWMATNSGTTSATRNNVPAMKYSVPGSLRVLDKNADGLADHMYFADTGGQIFRIDLDNTSKAPKLVKRVHRIATLGIDAAPGKANDRRFYETPAAAYAEDENGNIFAAVTIGSGNRNFPKSDKTTQERFFMIRDYDAARFDILKTSEMTEAGGGIGAVPNLATFSAPFTTADLADVTAVIGAAATTAVTGKKGWYINMGGAGRAGEKVLSSSFLFSRYDPVNKVNIYEVSFNSFLPDSGVAASCSPVAGATTAWRVLLANGSPAADLNNSGSITVDDRRRDGVATGITGSDVGLIRENAAGKLELKKLSGTNPETVGELPPGFGRMLRTRWFDQQ